MVKKEKDSKSIAVWQIVAGVVCLILISFFTIISFKAGSKEQVFFVVSMLSLIMGLLVEFRILTGNWLEVLTTSCFALMGSMLAFLPGKHEHNYSLEAHITVLPFVFLCIFLLLAIGILGKKIEMKLTEGITLMQSVALIYWMFDSSVFRSGDPVFMVVVFIGSLFCLYSGYQAFTYNALSNKERLILSVWSSLIMFLFASSNTLNAMQTYDVDITNNLKMGIYVALQFFLLGICSIYIFHNFYMLVRFLPEKHKFFNEEYFKEIKALKQEHIERYSPKQVSRSQSLFCILFSSLIFISNSYYRIVPVSTAIWLTFFSFPYVLAASGGFINRFAKTPDVI